MKQYVKLFEKDNQEPEEDEKAYDKKITQILKALRDENFGNEEQRKKLVDLLTSLHNSKDARARKIFKMIGDYCTDAIDEILK